MAGNETAEPAPKVPPLSLGLQVGYGLGSAAFGIGGVSLFSGLLLLYFNQVIGLPAVWVGAAIMTTVVIDAFTDPIIGFISDRLRSPLGRRHTLMYLAAVPAALGFFLMWHLPDGLAPPLMITLIIMMLMFVNISISLYEIPSLALAPELAPHYDQRSKLIAYRWLFFILSYTTMNVVLYQVFLRQDESNPLGVLNRDRYEQYGLISALIICAAILLSTAATQSRVKHLHVPERKPLSLRAELPKLKTALTHRPLLSVMFGGMMMGFAAGVTFGLANYFYLHFWELKPQQIGVLMAAYFIGSFVALWAGPAIGARLGKKRAIITFYALWLITAVGPLSLRLAGLMPPNDSPVLLPILFVNVTFGLGLALCCHIMLGSAIADAIDDIAAKTGARSEGLLFAGYSVLDKVAAGGGAFVAGAVVTMVGFPVGALPGTVDPAILREMAVINLAVVFVFNLASIALLSRYNLTRVDHERNAAILAARNTRAQKPAEAPQPAPAAVADASGRIA